jgi:hypothetical protein
MSNLGDLEFYWLFAWDKNFSDSTQKSWIILKNRSLPKKYYPKFIIFYEKNPKF